MSLILLLSMQSYSQKVKTEKGEYLMRIESNMSEDEAIKRARELAQINAIENAFGKVIFQGNATYIQNTSTNDRIETSNIFNFISDSYVNGEWIKTIDEQYKIINQNDGTRWIEMKVKGKIMEIAAVENNFEVQSLSCPEIKCKTFNFNNGQGLYIYFKSAKKGFINIYLDDPQMGETFKILPYQNTNNNALINFPVNGDFDYIFFSKEHDYLNEHNVDELILEAEKLSEQYKIFVLFSPDPFNKPILNDKTKDKLDKKSLSANFTLPKSIESEKFQKWLCQIRSNNKLIQLLSFQITVIK